MTRLVILDFDGTLADTQPLIVSTMLKVINALALPARTAEECTSVIGLPLRECFTRLLNIDDGKGEECAELYRRIFDEDNHPGVVTLFPHVLDTLKTLHNQGRLLAICSSRGRPTLDAFVRNFELEALIQTVVSANDVKHAKPHPEPVLKILKTLGVKASDALVVGDASFDIEMGCAAGCHTVGVTYGNQTPAQLKAAGAEHLITDFNQLMDIVTA